MGYIYHDGAFVREDKNTLRITSHPTNYGTAAFEGMRALWDPNAHTWFFFQPQKHYDRLKRGAEYLGIDYRMSFDEFISILSTLLKKNNHRSDVYLRPMGFYPTEGVGMMRAEGRVFAAYCEPKPMFQLKPATACVVPQRRPTDGSFATKLTGNYVLSFAAQLAAKKKKCNIGILCSDTGYVSEASAMNLFWVTDGELFTSSLACGALEGVTRNTLIRLAKDRFGIKVREGKYRPSVLGKAEEMFICGTGSGVSPIGKFERRKLKSANKESLTNQMWRHYEKTLRNRPELYAEWFVACR